MGSCFPRELRKVGSIPLSSSICIWSTIISVTNELRVILFLSMTNTLQRPLTASWQVTEHDSLSRCICSFPMALNYLSLYLYICLYIYLSICISICLSVSVYLSVYVCVCLSLTCSQSLSYPGGCLWAQIRVPFHPSRFLTLSGQSCRSTPPRPRGTPHAPRRASAAWPPVTPWRAKKYWHKTLTAPLKRLQQDKHVQLNERQTAKLIINWMIKVQRLLISLCLNTCSVFTSSALSWLNTWLSAPAHWCLSAITHYYT